MKHSSPKTKASAETSPRALLEAARLCLDRAYARYSEFPVAAAVVADDGRVFTGVNVENASYGLTMCAERVAIFTAVAAGARKLRALALTSQNSPAVMPCGACRQVMREFFDAAAPVYSEIDDENYKESTVGELLPDAFGHDDL